MNQLILLIAWMIAAGSASRAGEYILTGVVVSPGYARAFFCAWPGGQSFSLGEGEAREGLKLVRLDWRSEQLTLGHGTNQWTVDFPNARVPDGERGRSLARMEISPDWTGPWPPGYEPEIIRRHRAGIPIKDMREASSADQAIASGQYIEAIRAYIRELPAAERPTFQTELGRYAASPATQAAAVDTLTPHAIPTPINALNSTGRDVTTEAEPRKFQATRPGTADAEEVGRLRALARSEPDPDVRAQILASLTTLHADPIGAITGQPITANPRTGSP